MPHSSWGAPGLSRTVPVPVPGGGIQLNVHPEVAVIFRHLVDRLHAARVAAGRSPLTSSGGYVKRYVSGTTTWSNHSWGLAGDFCAAANPYSYVLRTDFPIEETRRIAASLGVRWGIDFPKRDPMHFEYAGSRDEAALLTRRLSATPTAPTPMPAPVRPAPVRPTPTTTEALVGALPNLSYRLRSKGHHVKMAQAMINAHGSFRTAKGRSSLDEDASFGPEMESAVKDKQRDWGLPQTGAIDLRFWAHLLGVA